jgi:predicted nucleotidyltransferase
MDIFKKITAELKGVEREEHVCILLAVESGSRAWGFPSADSDYDVRFIYAHHPNWYLSIDLEDRRDVIERPLKDMLDISGWDIRKALKLFRKSNPPLLEWLQCPIIYLENHSFAPRLRSLLPDFYSPQASYFHYLHMARGNFREYLQGESVWRKKYFYVLRPLLAIRWIEQGRGPVPIEFKRLVMATIDDVKLRRAIDELVDAKSKGE